MAEDARSGTRTDWRSAVRRRAEATGTVFPDAVVDELALHLEDLEAAAVATGASPAEARDRAAELLQESDLPHLRRRTPPDPRRSRAAQMEIESRIHRRRGGFSMLDALRVAVRQLRRHPRFVLIVLLVLGIGMGSATTVFTVLDAVLLQPLPYDAPDRLVALWDRNLEEGLPQEPLSPVNFMDYRALPVFEDAAAWWRPGVNLVDPELDPLRVETIEGTANLFRVLGVGPQIGPGFPEDGPLFRPDEHLAVISDRLWRQRYSADPSVLGRHLLFNDEPFTIVGVMPPGFHFPDDVDVWQRMDWDPSQHSRHAHFMEAVARLAPGTALEEARAAADSLALRLGEELADSNQGWTTRLVPLLDDQLGYYRPALLVLVGAVAILLAIAVLNVASLLLTRVLAREREIAIRIATGASPRQLVGQLTAESLVISLGGAVVGALAATVALPLFVALTPVEIPRLADAALDLRALGVGLAVVAVTTLVFGLVPAFLVLRHRTDASLRSGDRGSSRRTRRVYSALIAGEVALACALLVGSALLVRTVHEMTATPTGVSADDVVTAPVQLSRESFDPSLPVPERWRLIAQAHTRLLEEVRSQPGVISAGATNFLPLEEGWRVEFHTEELPVPEGLEEAPKVQIHSVSDGYFETLGARLAAGRFFVPDDDPDAPGTAVVNRSFADQFLPEGGSVGRAVRIWATGIGPLGVNLKATQRQHPEGLPFEVVGVVEDVRNAPLGQAVVPAIYFSTRQFPFVEQTLAVRAVDPATASAAIRNALQRVAPNVPPGTMETWGERFAVRTAEPRLLMSLLGAFGGIAALLAATGVYGLFSWSVATRRRELAIRLTLGADPPGVARLLFRQSAVLIVTGLTAGIAVVHLSRSALATVVYGVSPTDAASTAAAASVLLVAALVACVPPVIRSMRVDPVEGLRAE